MSDKEIEVFETTAGQVTDMLKRLGVAKERLVTVMTGVVAVRNRLLYVWNGATDRLVSAEG